MKVSFETVTSDRACTGCGYNLKGLAVTGKCPECGAAITESAGNTRGIRKRRPSSNMGDAPLTFLIPFGLALLGLAVSGPLLIAIVLLFASSGLRPSSAVGASVIAFFWVASCMTLLRSRPQLAAVSGGDQSAVWQWWLLRCSVGLSQPLVLGIIAVLGARYGNDSAALDAAQRILIGIVVIGLAPLAMILANYADWAGDQPMHARFRTVIFVLAVAPIIAGGIPLLSRVHVSFGMFTGLVGLCSLAWLCGVLVMCFSALQMVTMTNWVVVNRREALARDARVLERARAAGMPGAAAAAIEAGIPLGIGGIVGGFGPRAEEAATEPHSLLPPPGTPKAGEKTTHRIEPTTGSPYALEDSSPMEP